MLRVNRVSVVDSKITTCQRSIVEINYRKSNVLKRSPKEGVGQMYVGSGFVKD